MCWIPPNDIDFYSTGGHNPWGLERIFATDDSFPFGNTLIMIFMHASSIHIFLVSERRQPWTDVKFNLSRYVAIQLAF